MPVEKPNVIDVLAQDPATKEVKLIMVEARKFSAEAELQLHNKFTCYADFILSGNILIQYPDYANCPISIELHHFHPLSKGAEALLKDWSDKLSGAPVAVWTKPATMPRTGLLQKFFPKPEPPQAERARCSPAGKSVALVTHAQFTEEFAVALRNAAPARPVEVVTNLQLRFAGPDAQGQSIFLDNARAQYWAAPGQKAEIIRKYVASFLTVQDTLAKDGIQLNQIVPVLKDKGWLDEVNQSLKERSAEKKLEQLFEPYNEALVILYAEDSPQNIRYLTAEDFKRLNLELPALRKLAVENLERVLPAPNVESAKGVHRIKAGGDYEASLLLLKSLWEEGNIPVNGEIVAAIPARDWLLVTGSKDANGLRTVRTLAQKIVTSAPYRLTSQLFVYRGGTFVVFKE